MGKMPNFYPDGMPLYWRDELSGVLPAAVWKYYDHVLGRGALAAGELELLWDYVEHHIQAPCWEITCAEC